MRFLFQVLLLNRLYSDVVLVLTIIKRISVFDRILIRFEVIKITERIFLYTKFKAYIGNSSYDVTRIVRHLRQRKGDSQGQK